MGKQAERSTRSREKLIEATKALLKERDVDHIGVRDIAKAAGVTTGTFYYHFESKGDIVSQIYREKDVVFQAIFQQLAETPPYRDRVLDFFCTHLVAHILEDGINHTMQRMFHFKVKTSLQGSYIYFGMATLLEKGKAAGEFDPAVPTEEMLHTLFLVHWGIVYDWCITDESIRPELAALERQIMMRVLDTFLAPAHHTSQETKGKEHE